MTSPWCHRCGCPGCRCGDGVRAAADDDEDRLTALQAHLDGDALELVGDLGRRVREGVHERQSRGGFEREADPLGGLLGLRTHRPGRLGEIPTQCVDVLGDVHVHHNDTTVMSCQHHGDITLPARSVATLGMLLRQPRARPHSTCAGYVLRGAHRTRAATPPPRSKGRRCAASEPLTARPCGPCRARSRRSRRARTLVSSSASCTGWGRRRPRSCRSSRARRTSRDDGSRATSPRCARACAPRRAPPSPRSGSAAEAGRSARCQSCRPTRPQTPGELAVTWYGHATRGARDRRRTVPHRPRLQRTRLTDPPLGPQAACIPCPGTLDEIPTIDAVLISHDHYDHLDQPSIVRLEETHRPHYVVPLGVNAHLLAWGVPEERITALDWRGETEVAGIRLTCTEARHNSGRGLVDSQTLWAGLGPARAGALRVLRRRLGHVEALRPHRRRPRPLRPDPDADRRLRLLLARHPHGSGAGPRRAPRRQPHRRRRRGLGKDDAGVADGFIEGDQRIDTPGGAHEEGERTTTTHTVEIAARDSSSSRCTGPPSTCPCTGGPSRFVASSRRRRGRHPRRLPPRR